MRQRSFTLASAASLALWLTTVVLWADSWRPHGPASSFGREITFREKDGVPHWVAVSRTGLIVITVREGDGGTSGGPIAPTILPGFKYEGFRGSDGQFLFLTTPHRAWAIVFGILPALWIYQRLQRRRRRGASGFPVHPTDE